MLRNLKAEMVRRGISQAEMAKQLGITRETVSKKISGVSDFTIKQALKIIKILNIKMSIPELFNNGDSDGNN